MVIGPTINYSYNKLVFKHLSYSRTKSKKNFERKYTRIHKSTRTKHRYQTAPSQIFSKQKQSLIRNKNCLNLPFTLMTLHFLQTPQIPLTIRHQSQQKNVKTNPLSTQAETITKLRTRAFKLQPQRKYRTVFRVTRLTCT